MILVTGATGFVGQRVCKLLEERKLEFSRTSLSLGTDLRSRDATDQLFGRVQPSHVINCAAFVGGIQFGYKYPVELFQNNLQMTLNILHAAQLHDVQRIVNPISNCAYPADARIFRAMGSVAYGAGLFSPALDAGDFARRFHGNDERIDTESLALTTNLWCDVVSDVLR